MLSKLQDRYREFVSLYQGCGQLNQQDCNFEIGQTANGAILLYPSLDVQLPSHRKYLEIELKGTTEDSRPLHATGTAFRQGVFGALDFRYHSYNSYNSYNSGNQFTVEIGNLIWKDTHQVKFALTNLLFCGNDTDSFNWLSPVGNLNVQLDGTSLSIEKRENYYDLINPVGRGESTKVTSTLIVDVARKTKTEILELADIVCDLLTIGTGRKISWISYTVSDASGTDVYSFHEYRFTDMRAGRELIDFKNGKTIATFLEQCYPAYKMYDSQNPGMLHSVGLMLIDANSKGFMRTRALIVFSMLDAVSYTESKHNTLKGRIRDIVDLYRVPIEKCQAKRCGRGCGTCQPKCDGCKNQCEAECEIGDFVEGRHSIVHKLQFPSSDEDKEYFKVLSVFHRLLLRMLGYESYFVDVRYRHDPRFRINLLRPTT